jgi:hypothetical protein
MHGAAGAAFTWATYWSSAVFSRAVGSYFAFPALGLFSLGFLHGLKPQISWVPNLGRPLHGVVFQKLNTPPPFWQNEAKFTNDFKDRAADL